jgi:hypothetical protein
VAFPAFSRCSFRIPALFTLQTTCDFFIESSLAIVSFYFTEWAPTANDHLHGSTDCVLCFCCPTAVSPHLCVSASRIHSTPLLLFFSAVRRDFFSPLNVSMSHRGTRHSRRHSIILVLNSRTRVHHWLPSLARAWRSLHFLPAQLSLLHKPPATSFWITTNETVHSPLAISSFRFNEKVLTTNDHLHGSNRLCALLSDCCGLSCPRLLRLCPGPFER